jgi:hypothetical protein
MSEWHTNSTRRSNMLLFHLWIRWDWIHFQRCLKCAYPWWWQWNEYGTSVERDFLGDIRSTIKHCCYTASLSPIHSACVVLGLNPALWSEKPDCDRLICDMTHIHSTFISVATGTSTKGFMSLSSPHWSYLYYTHVVSKSSPRYDPKEKII